MRKRHQQALLYSSYLFTCLEDRGWSFAISLCMQLLGGMQLVSIEQLGEGIAQMVLSGPIGRAVDRRSDRRWGMIVCLMGNNCSILASCALFAACLTVDRSTWIYVLSLVSGMLFCSTYRLFVTAEKNLSSRDWALVLVDGSEPATLAKVNALLTSLDQLANVVSPLLLGLVLSFVSLRTSCIVLGGCSLVSLAIKGCLLLALYNSNERFHIKMDKEGEAHETEESSKYLQWLASIPRVLHTYYAQKVFPAALGMALLFMTVMGFDGLAIGYGESVGLPENIIGFFRSFGSAAGVAGAVMYAVMARFYGVERTGTIGMAAQEVCLLLAVASIYMPGSPFNPSGYFDTLTFSSWWSSLLSSFSPSSSAPPLSSPSSINWASFTTASGTSLISITAFLVGIATSRFGLWMADLAITHIMQVNAPESQRNTVFGVHNAICQTFSVLKDLLVIVLPSPATFGICIFISFGFVCSGFAAYLYYVIKVHKDGEEVNKLMTKM